MRKVFIVMIIVLVAASGYAQDGMPQSKKEKARQRREHIEGQRKRDSIEYEERYRLNQYSRADWEREKKRRDSMSAEQLKAIEDERLNGEQAKKVSKTGKSTLTWMTIFMGYNASTKTGDDPGYSNVGGLVFGIHTHIFSFSDYVGLGVGADFSMQGGKYESHEYVPGGSYGTSSATSRLNYLNFPILFHYQRKSTGFFADAGIQPGILLSAKNKGSTTTDIKDEVKKFDVGIPIGAGYQFKNKIGVSLRVTPGLINVNKDDQYKNRNMVASLRASYSL